MAEAYTCVVCSEDVDEKMSAECHSCGERYHLNPRNDEVAKDCGAVWINEHHLALEFACQRCIDRDTGDQKPPPASPPNVPARVITPTQPSGRRYRRRD